MLIKVAICYIRTIYLLSMEQKLAAKLMNKLSSSVGAIHTVYQCFCGRVNCS